MSSEDDSALLKTRKTAGVSISPEWSSLSVIDGSNSSKSDTITLPILSFSLLAMAGAPWPSMSAFPASTIAGADR